jgi:hypothetical protein
MRQIWSKAQYKTMGNFPCSNGKFPIANTDKRVEIAVKLNMHKYYIPIMLLAFTCIHYTLSSFIEKPTVVNNRLTPISPEAADRYIQNFQQSAAYKAMNEVDKDATKAIYFDAATINNMAALVQSGQIDGMWAYYAKYDTPNKDPKHLYNNQYTIILWGAKQPVEGKSMEKIILRNSQGEATNIENYGKPCPPFICN